MKGNAKTMAVGGLAGWLLGRLRATRRSQSRLALLERIALAPRQSLALVEADGRRFLVATSPEGAPAFYALDGESRPGNRCLSAGRARPVADRSARISW
jgi:flagellar biogenesis protein FliO